MYSRRLFGSTKSLLHFDYPHSGNNSGLKDEASIETWRLNGNACFAGKYSPVDFRSTNAPKFGYRCLYTQSNNDFAYSTNSSGTFNISKDYPLNAEAFVNVLSSSAGNIIAFMNSGAQIIALSLTSERKIALTSQTLSVSITSATVLNLNTWYHVRAIIAPGTCQLFVDGTGCGSANFTAQNISVTAVNIGGCHAFLDEFRLSNDTYATVPGAPYQAQLDLGKMGGFGTGADGNFTKESGALIVNPYSTVNKASGTAITISTWHAPASCPAPDLMPGDELIFTIGRRISSVSAMIGYYAFRRVLDRKSSVITIDRPITEEFDLEDLVSRYLIRVSKVPNFKNFTLGRNAKIIDNAVGVCAFRTTENCTWLGFAGTQANLVYDGDTVLTHSDLPDRMYSALFNLIVCCGGTFTADAASRIGTNTKKTSQAGYYSDYVMAEPNTKYRPGEAILIAAKILNIDSEALAYGSTTSNRASGLCYLAGDLS